MDIAFIGGGVMAEALIGGIINGGIASGGEVFVGEPISNRRSYLENTILKASFGVMCGPSFSIKNDAHRILELNHK